jgi:exosortase
MVGKQSRKPLFVHSPIARLLRFAYPYHEESPDNSSVLSPAAQAASPPLAAEPPYLATPLWQILLLCGVLAWLYASVLGHLVAQWNHDPNYSHGFFVPAFSLYVLWQQKSRLQSLPLRPSWSGLLVLAFALMVLMAGVLGAELFLSRLSFLLAIGGLVVLTYGWNLLRACLFPWLFMLFMIPIPNIVFNEITFPLQLLASKAAAWTLPMLGVPVLREGNVIQLPAMALEVAEACSGIRSLMSLATLAVIYGYLLEPKKSIRVALAIASVPIAVLANSSRIVGTGLLVQYWDPEKAEGFFHAFSGWLIFVVSLVLLFLLHRALQLAWPKGEAR